GTVSKNGGRYPRAVFSASDKSLSYDVWRLARSLGLKATRREKRATLYGRDCGASYEVSFAASKDVPVFRLGRKQSLLPDRIAKRSRTLTIVGCEERSEEHTSELQSRENLVCRLLLEKKKNNIYRHILHKQL